MPDIQTTVTAIVGAVTPVGLAVGWWLRRRDTRQDPIPKDAAAVALAQSGVALMQGVADDMKAQMADLRSEVAEVRAEQTSMRLTLSAAIRHIERLLRAWPSPGPSRPPLPTDLRDLIDPALHD